jgi:hypothetical protein
VVAVDVDVGKERAMSESFCGVSLGDYDGDEATFYHEREVTGRKPHDCFECRGVIAKGERHNVVSGKWDGEVRTYRFCAGCWEVMGEFSENGRTFGVVWETFESEWASGATLQGCLNRLTSVSAKQHMTRQWQKFKGLE